MKPEKCSFFQSQIRYLGFIVSKDGRRPDPAKIQAISDMPVPTDVSTLRSFLGMINHYQQFVKNMRFIRQPLDDLLKQDAVWAWTPECQDAFDKVIKLLNSDQLLAHYDPSQEIIVSADASEHGIGAVISHRFADGSQKAVAHASCSLSPAEKNYSQIEKEGLALVYNEKVPQVSLRETLCATNGSQTVADHLWQQERDQSLLRQSSTALGIDTFGLRLRHRIPKHTGVRPG